MGKKETYLMRYTCDNCNYVFTKEIPKGICARGQGGKCPYCYCLDGSFGRPDHNLKHNFKYERATGLLESWLKNRMEGLVKA